MRVYFFTEDRLVRNKDGNIYIPQGVNNYHLLKTRYLSVFDEVVFVARVIDNSEYVGDNYRLVEGPNVKVHPLPYYIGPKGFLMKKNKIVAEVKKTINNYSAYILRLPGAIGSLAYAELKKHRIKYSVEVVGDPFDVFSKGGVTHPLRLFFKYYTYNQLKKIVENADNAMYVTQSYLQERYPNKKASHYASNVNISDDFITNSPRIYLPKKHYSIISIGSLEQMYKAPDVLLQAVKDLKDSGIHCSLKWIGDGKYKSSVQKLAKNIGIENQVEFLGFISDKLTIKAMLDEADFFVLASRTEGLPRVIPEAFARALPVIGTKVGGIPELLQEDLLVDPNNSIQIAEKVTNLINNPKLSSYISKQNLVKANDFLDITLQKRRISFYQCVKDSYNS